MFLVAPVLALGLSAPPLQTAPERTQWQATSTLADIQTFMGALSRRHRELVPYHPKGAPRTAEGGAPLLAWRLPATGKAPLRVHLNANIHAGEVEGKEAVQMLVRELLEGRHPALRKHLDLVIMPACNADATDALDPANRRHQPNPASGVGRRENHLGLDLNRDMMKAESRSARFLLALTQDFDPHLVVDHHATNGSCHGFHLTYSHAQTAAADPALVALNRRMLQEVRAALTPQGLDTYDYGDFEGGEPARGGLPKAWSHFDPRPRYLSNYPSLRHRLGVLSEAFVYKSFAERVAISRAFTLACLAWAAEHREEVRTRLAEGEKAWQTAWKTGRPALPLDADRALTEEATFRAFIPERGPDGAITAIKAWQTHRLPAYVTATPKDFVPAPDGYLVDPVFAATVRPLLEAHGLRILPGSQRPQAPLQHFHETGRTLSPEAYQGIFPLTLRGSWKPTAPERARILPWRPQDLDRALYIPLDQPLGRLAFVLLDPRSNDSLVHWGLFHSVLLRGRGMWGEPTRFPLLAVGDFQDVPSDPQPAGPARKAE